MIMWKNIIIPKFYMNKGTVYKIFTEKLTRNK